MTSPTQSTEAPAAFLSGVRPWIIASVIAITVVATIVPDTPPPPRVLRPPRVVLHHGVSSLVIPGAGMAKVRLGMRPVIVRKLLGRPANRHRLRPPAGDLTVWNYPRQVLHVRFRKTYVRKPAPPHTAVVVGSISTTSRHWRTHFGIGVGSSEAAVTRVYTDAYCENFVSGLRDCSLGGQRNGDPETDFFIRNGHVREVGVTFGYSTPY
ncbi:MAG TPA: hypothetical protein VHE14_07355 [Solirubrobacteraceae bacterium]|nr:hypothetical protein [Solirubrobacteraceae bacterium]